MSNLPKIDDLVVKSSNRALVGRIFAVRDLDEMNYLVLIIWSTNLQDLADTFEMLKGATLDSAEMVSATDLEYVQRWDYWTTK